ncbi:MAG: hypothetical protein KatS3mg110_3221 [Pirellulaceae bacterium]|nr:MAG: hypothetical protein KatS3mg110_3221 [Pirellulaceae bacterium]
MPREVPDVATSWVPPAPAHPKRCQELVTPMFGGEVEPWANDPNLPIRPTAIRGQFQFWWRAAVSAACCTKDPLWEMQSQIRGNAGHAGPVRIQLELLGCGEPRPSAEFQRDMKDSRRCRSMPSWKMPFQRTALPYALFPFQGQLAADRPAVEIQPAAWIQRGLFRLNIHGDDGVDYLRHGQPAHWGWVNLGGLGSPTRRGCGAIRCNALAARNSDELKRRDARNRPGSSRWREPETIQRIIHRRALSLGNRR